MIIARYQLYLPVIHNSKKGKRQAHAVSISQLRTSAVLSKVPVALGG